MQILLVEIATQNLIIMVMMVSKLLRLWSLLLRQFFLSKFCKSYSNFQGYQNTQFVIKTDPQQNLSNSCPSNEQKHSEYILNQRKNAQIILKHSCRYPGTFDLYFLIKPIQLFLWSKKSVERVEYCLLTTWELARYCFLFIP